MGEDGRNFRHIAADLGFEQSDAVMSFLQAQVLVQFKVLLNVEMAMQVLHTDIMYVEILARRHGTNLVKNIFRVHCPWDRVHDYVGIRENIVNGHGDCVGDLLGALESHVARQSDGKIGKVAIAGAANPHPIHFEQSIHFRNRGNNPVAHAGRSGVEKGVDGSTG